MSRKNVVELNKHRVTSECKVSNEKIGNLKGNSVNISEKLRSTIDDDLKQQMREQLRRKHGFK